MRLAWLAIIACVYFVVNTLIVSGVLSLLTGSALADVNDRFYIWSLPYYLTGTALVGVLPIGDNRVAPECWLIPLPMLYLIHFYYGLEGRRAGTPEPQAGERMRPRARGFITLVVGCGAVVAGSGLVNWNTPDAGWLPSLLVLPSMWLTYHSYRLHVNAAGGNGTAGGNVARA